MVHRRLPAAVAAFATMLPQGAFAAEAGMELSGHLLTLDGDKLVIDD